MELFNTAGLALTNNEKNKVDPAGFEPAGVWVLNMITILHKKTNTQGRKKNKAAIVLSKIAKDRQDLEAKIEYLSRLLDKQELDKQKALNKQDSIQVELSNIAAEKESIRSEINRLTRSLEAGQESKGRATRNP